jgi:hypothetical protein
MKSGDLRKEVRQSTSCFDAAYSDLRLLIVVFSIQRWSKPLLARCGRGN